VGVTSTVLVVVVVDAVASGVPEALGASRVLVVSVVVVASLFWQPIAAPTARSRKPARVRVLFMVSFLLDFAAIRAAPPVFATSVPSRGVGKVGV
jgi:hypothetical protein